MLSRTATDSVSDHLVPGVDPGGRLVDALPDAEALLSIDPRDRAVVEGLLAAYRYILASHDTIRAALERAEHAEREAYEDHLTGLPNRRAWDHELAREQARCDRNASAAGIVVVDIDNLKVINDEQGHLAGDLLVRQTAGLLRQAFRGADMVARIGGDEFAVLVVDFDVDAAQPELLADRVRSVLARGGTQASVGAAVHAAGLDLTEVFARADEAMYAHKGHNRARPTGACLTHPAAAVVAEITTSDSSSSFDLDGPI